LNLSNNKINIGRFLLFPAVCILSFFAGCKPVVNILSPEDGSIFEQGEMITFIGSAQDVEDGELTGNSLLWSSNINGEIGTGALMSNDSLGTGDHTITLTATNSDGEWETDEITISVKEADSNGGNVAGVELAIAETGSLQNPAWSPDGTKILFTRFRNGYNKEPADLLIFNLEDKSVRTLVSDGSGNVNLPGSSWNSVNHKITFSSSREPHDEIFIINEDGSPGDEMRVTERSFKAAYEPTFSSDGLWLVFESHMLEIEGNGVITKFKSDAAGSYVTLSGENDDCRQPNWSPAGDLILYQKLDLGKWDIWVMTPNGTNHTRVTMGPGDKTDASFSPDGKWIVYSSDEGNLEFANLFMAPVTGGDSIRITEGKNYDGAPSWSPDGSMIVYESYQGDPDDSDGTTLWIVNVPEH
jgi:TolB protein